MNSIIKDFNNLIFLSNSLCSGNKPLTSIEQLIICLKDFKETHSSDIESGNFLHLKLTLLANLMFILRMANKNDQKCSIIKYMIDLLRTSVIDDIEFFILLYNSVFHQIYESGVPLSEEIKLAVLECSIELIKRSTKRILQLLYDVNYGAKFSMGVFIAVQIAKEEKGIKLRTTALDFLLFAMQYHRKTDKILQDSVGDLFMLYLPGVIGRLQEIIMRDETQPHVITVKAITCWGQLMCIVMHDLEEKETTTDVDQIKMWMTLSKEANGGEPKSFDWKNALQEKSRSRSWLQAAAQTLRPLILKIPAARKHSHPKVRLELTNQISRVLNNCLVNLKSVSGVLIEILISSSEDEVDEVREAAEFAITRFENRCRHENGQVYLSFIEENLNALINKMPNIIHLKEDKDILNAMRSLFGELKILSNSNRLGQIIGFSSNLTRLFRVLTLISKLELYPEISVKEYSAWDSQLNSSVWKKQWKRFKHFADDKILRKLVEICGLLGESGEKETILDYLFDKFNEDGSSRNETLLLINEVICGSENLQDNIVKQFLDVYLDPQNLYMKLEVDDEECTNLQQSHTNIITVTLLMEGLGKLASCLGQKFNDYMLRSLYFVVEKMGNSLRLIRNSATDAAVQISHAVGFGGDIGPLIETNVDYLTYHITVKLKRNAPGVFDVVTVLMKNSPFQAVTNLEEIINNVLRSASDQFDSPHTMSYLRLFQTFVLCVAEWMKSGENEIGNVKEENVEAKSEVDLLIEFIKQKEKPKEDSDGEDLGENEEQDAEADSDYNFQNDVEKSKNLPKHIQLTLSIAETALNYLPSKDFSKKLIVLEILNDSIWILADRENQLLPLVHKIWSPLVTRFENVVDPLIINRSFTLLYSMSRTSKDFIRRRTLKNVLPTLREFLFKSAEKSKLKDSGTGYHYTQNFKLQKELLNKLGILAIDLRLDGKDLDCVVECALPYLSSLQPQPLQENCRKLLSDFKDYDPYLIWYKLHIIKNDSEYSRNAEIVLDHVMS